MPASAARVAGSEGSQAGNEGSQAGSEESQRMSRQAGSEVTLVAPRCAALAVGKLTNRYWVSRPAKEVHKVASFALAKEMMPVVPAVPAKVVPSGQQVAGQQVAAAGLLPTVGLPTVGLPSVGLPSQDPPEPLHCFGPAESLVPLQPQPSETSTAGTVTGIARNLPET